MISRRIAATTSAERILHPVRDARSSEIVGAAMLHRQAEVRITNAGARAGLVGFDHDQPAIDLLAPDHPRGIFLADEAAFREDDAVQFGSIAFEPEDVAKLEAAFGYSEAHAVLESPAPG